MVHTAVLGMQWGDEGKGKIIDLLAKDHDIIVRCQGGANAGHTVVVNGIKHAFHLLPSAVLYSDKICILGNGMVIDPNIIIKELDKIKDIPHAEIIVSNRAHITTPELIAEDQRTGAKIGTTGKGIGPTYRDKILRTGVRLCDFIDNPKYDSNLRGRLAELVQDTSVLLDTGIFEGQRILFEGAQAAMLDIDLGTYPFVTSSNTTIGGIFTGSGVYIQDLDIIGVSKAYTTRVGNGPFPTKLEDMIGDQLREKGGEYGTTTGRPRDCGWLDIPVLDHARRSNGIKSLAITKLDVLTGINPIKVCIGYKIEGVSVSSAIPASAETYAKYSPKYEEFQGWTEDITGCRSFDELPGAARNYLDFIEKQVQVSLKYIGVGPDRSQIILR